MRDATSRAVIWINRDLTPTERSYALAEEACAAHAFAKDLRVAIKVWSSSPVDMVHESWGTLHQTLRRHDAYALIIPNPTHIHIASARKWCRVFSVAGDDEWSWNLNPTRQVNR